ncbi:hypothetical protein [Shewanella sp. MBTL60-007]|uniref:hypothetical protein n=1 Tax=Shewanella sp. MBTL60-007 TaxID=2815911 RepID=UPI001C81C3CB|nr:hypothetical protein [Shewanella sp. MBTL60-007]
MQKEFIGMFIGVTILLTWLILFEAKSSPPIFLITIERLFITVSLLFTLLYSGLFKKSKLAIHLIPMTTCSFWFSLTPMLTLWGTTDKFPYGNVIEFYASSTFHILMGCYIFLWTYGWILLCIKKH